MLLSVTFIIYTYIFMKCCFNYSVCVNNIICVQMGDFINIVHSLCIDSISTNVIYQKI